VTDSNEMATDTLAQVVLAFITYINGFLSFPKVCCEMIYTLRRIELKELKLSKDFYGTFLY